LHAEPVAAIAEAPRLAPPPPARPPAEPARPSVVIGELRVEVVHEAPSEPTRPAVRRTVRLPAPASRARAPGSPLRFGLGQL